MDLNRSIIRSEVRQALEEYLQSNTNISANAGETGRLEGSCKLILLCTSLPSRFFLDFMACSRWYSIVCGWL